MSEPLAPQARPERPKVRRRGFLLVAALLLAGVAAACGARALQRHLEQPFKGYSGSEQFVDLPPGSTPAAIGRRLVESGIVADAITFRVALWRSGAARRLKAGEYRFERALTPAEVIDKLARGDVFCRSITFPEGLTIRDMARVYEAQGFGSAAEFLEAAQNASLIADLDPAARDLEGYLFPDTYAVSRHATARQLVALMVNRFKSVFQELQAAQPAAGALTLRQIVTLASIVEKETARPEERPLVASVYLNRLARRMGLQSDPTVIYALERAGLYRGNLTRDHLSYDSPYNTYRRAGLPPGPIAAPSRSALAAVLAPAETEWLYFVSRNDGTHVFARTLAEHNRNVQRYQVDFFRARRAPVPRPGATRSR